MYDINITINRIKDLIDKSGKTQAEFLRDINANKNLLRTDKGEMKTSVLMNIADYFNVSVDYLLGRCECAYIPTVKTFITPAGAGKSIPFDSDDEYEWKVFPLDTVPQNTDYAIRVSGRSMEKEYPNECYVFVKRRRDDETYNIGDDIIAIHEGCPYLKRLGKGVLRSLNPEYDDIPITEDTCFFGKVLGKYIE